MTLPFGPTIIFETRRALTQDPRSLAYLFQALANLVLIKYEGEQIHPGTLRVVQHDASELVEKIGEVLGRRFPDVEVSTGPIAIGLLVVLRCPTCRADLGNGEPHRPLCGDATG